mmetsp:Transcript_6683/g.28036  ORF Transcript_6683/g.28036 Transcript_6683/m.28036 type:complete len:282 (+) Transcript_6683:844-1689(+)
MGFSATARVLMKATAGRFTSTQLMGVQYVVIVTAAFALTVATGSLRVAWRPLWRAVVTERDGAVIAAVVGLSLVVQWLAAESQVVLIRRLGPALYTSFQPSRIATTVAVGALVLKEPVRGLGEWLGLCLVVGAVGAYLALRVLRPLDDDDHSEKEQRRRRITSAIELAPSPSPRDAAEPNTGARTSSSSFAAAKVVGVVTPPSAAASLSERIISSAMTINGWHPRPFPPALRWSPMGGVAYAVVPAEDEDGGDEADGAADDSTTVSAPGAPTDKLLETSTS